MKRSRAIYAATIFAMVALTAGFVLGAISLTTSTQNAAGQGVNPAGGVNGLTYTSTVLSVTPTTALSGPGSPAAPIALAVGANSFCADTCTAGHFAEAITYTFAGTAAPPFAGYVMITVTITATPGTSGGTGIVYVEETGTDNGQIIIYWDFATGTTAINSVTLAAQQCVATASPWCP